MKRKVLTLNEAIDESNRCLKCANPKCIKACPLANNIPLFIENIKNNNIQEAYSVLCETSIMPEVCSVVCPMHKQCEGNCVLGIKGNNIKISQLEEFVANYVLKDNKYLEYFNKEKNENNNKKIAIIGMGPAGIGAAYYLLKKGFDVTIFEKENVAGGILTYGIPDFRLSKYIVVNVINKLIKMGLIIKYNMELGKNLSIDILSKKGYKAIILALGLSKSNKLNVEGEQLNNIINGNEFLYKYNMIKNEDLEKLEDKQVVIVGGGNVAIDCARVSKRLKAKSVTILYRRTLQEMPVSKSEYEQTISEGVQMEYLTLPIKFIGNDKVQEIECVKMKLGDLDETGRRKSYIIDNSNFIIKADFVINCLGSSLDTYFIKKNIKNIDICEKINIIRTNEYGQTSIPNIFIAGDMLNKEKTVAYAVNSGRQAGIGIEKYFENLGKNS